MKKTLLLLSTILTTISFAQNVGINSTGAAPAASAMLDVASTNKGLLIPNVALTALNAAGPITAPATSLLVYNTATAGVSPNNVVPGYYYWDGAKWVALGGNGSLGWGLLGNAGTAAGTNFLGTTDNVDLQFRVNNIQGGKINIANAQTFFGYQAGNITTGNGNSFFGSNSGVSNVGGTFNTALGNLTFTTNTIGNFNTIAGYGSMRSNLSGGSNTFMGVNAGANWSTASNNTGIGMFALQGLAASTGEYNSALGYAAGSGYSVSPNYLAVSSGSYNTFLGYSSALSTGSFSNSTGVGAFSQIGASNVIVLGSITGTNGATASSNVGIGTTAPNFPLTVTRNNANFVGVVLNSNAGFTAFTGQNSAAAGAGAGSGVLGRTNQSGGAGLLGFNSNVTGTGAIIAGNNAGLGSLTAGSGVAASGTDIGVVSFATTVASGWGILSGGNNQAVFTLAGGGGGSFTGTQWGAFGNAITATNAVDRASFIGNYNSVGSTNQTVYVGARIAGVHYKILGSGGGSVSTTMLTRNGERVLFAPESPENWFFDIGEVQLINGKATVYLDETFVDCLSDSKPFKVFVQGSENTLGNIRISRNQTDKSFIVEDLGGASNGIVQYNIYGIWKGKENLRFPEYKRTKDVEPVLQEKVVTKLTETN